MRWDAATYGSSFADVYDDWYGHRGDEAAVVHRLATLAPQTAGDRRPRVLELGVGTGRLAFPLAAAGWEVVGIDASPEMLGQLAAKAPTGDAVVGVLGDAAEPRSIPGGPFDVVLAAFNFLFNLPDREAQRRCLAACRARVVDAGRLVVESFVPDPSMRSGRSEARGPVSGVRVVTEADAGRAAVVGEHVDGSGRRRPWRVCFASPSEIDALAAAAGWVLVERHEDWDGTPFHPDDSPQHVSAYRPA
jgi:SAM-dependent methyltransferase